MEGNHIHITPWLLPLSWLYGLGVNIRNKMFDHGMLPSRSFSLPVICIGNITVGGTGKTPHTEYLIRLLSSTKRIAVLSRGYKRKSKGFVLASPSSTVAEIGDEPCQMKRKFPLVQIAVDRDRCHGITQLISGDISPKPEVILLDDAFQHRYVQAGLNIVLMDYHRVTYLDKLLPAGRLREPQSGLRRADIIIVTKCPIDMTDNSKQTIRSHLSPLPSQQLFFTRYRYPDTIEGIKGTPILLTGIASPLQMAHDLQHILPDIELMSFPDHHNFSPEDMDYIRRHTAGRTILTTEKDATRLQGLDNIRVIPIEVEFLDDMQSAFDQTILKFVHSFAPM